jgi:hypothetical protein
LINGIGPEEAELIDFTTDPLALNFVIDIAVHHACFA